MLKTWLQVSRTGDEGRGAREEEVEDPAYRFPSIQDQYHTGITTTTREEIEQMIGAELPEQEQAPSTSQATD